MSRIALRRGVVLSVDREAPFTALTVEVDGHLRPALVDVGALGPCEAGDEVVVNTAALDLELGSGGFDLVHVNLTRGLDGGETGVAHVMKLNYSSVQHAIEPIEGRAPELDVPLAGTVAVISLHAQLPCVAWQVAQRLPRARIGFVQTVGGALPGRFSRVVAELVERELLAGHITAGQCYGGGEEAITAIGAIHAGLTVLGWDGVIAGPGPGILGSGSTLGHGGLAALDSAHAALALGARTLIVPRMSSGDDRERHRGLSHHTRTVLDLLLASVAVAWPAEAAAITSRHASTRADIDLEGYLASGLPARTMGRDADQDPLFFEAALTGGAVLGAMIDGV